MNNKSLLIKIGIAVVAVVLLVSTFWFFKVGQLEKQINKFAANSNSSISIGELSVGGFPFSQKVHLKDVKLSLTNLSIEPISISIQNIEADAKIFSYEFVVTKLEGLTLMDSSGSVSNVELNGVPSLSFSIADGRLLKLNYQDSGYKVKNGELVIYSSASNNISLDSVLTGEKDLKSKILLDFKGVEGIEASSLYKLVESKLVNLVKSGEIALSNQSDASAEEIMDDDSSDDSEEEVAEAEGVKSTQDQSANDNSKNNQTIESAVNSATNVNSINPVKSSNLPTQPQGSGKMNFVATIEYSYTDPNDAASAPIALAPPSPMEVNNAQQPKNESEKLPDNKSQAQIQPSGATSKGGEVIKITNMELSNDLYKIIISSGDLIISPDDNLPSGWISVKIENLKELSTQFSHYLTKKLGEQNNLSSSLSIQAPQAAAPTNSQGSSAATNPITNDLYKMYLERMSAKVIPVSEELSEKNPVSSQNAAQFDVRREKNLEILINEVPLREILGKLGTQGE